MATRSFVRNEAARPQGEEHAPLVHQFTLGGTGQLSGDPWSESFRALGRAPAAALDALARSITVDETGEVVAFDNVSVVAFFNSVIHPDDERRFAALARDKDRTVTLEELVDVLLWLGEVYSDRPTREPSTSTTGVSPSGAT